MENDVSAPQSVESSNGDVNEIVKSEDLDQTTIEPTGTSGTGIQNSEQQVGKNEIPFQMSKHSLSFRDLKCWNTILDMNISFEIIPSILYLTDLIIQDQFLTKRKPISISLYWRPFWYLLIVKFSILALDASVQRGETHFDGARAPNGHRSDGLDLQPYEGADAHQTGPAEHAQG